MKILSKEELLKREILEDEVLVWKCIWSESKPAILTILYTDGTWENIEIVEVYAKCLIKVNEKWCNIINYFNLQSIPRYWRDNLNVYKITKDEFLDYIYEKRAEVRRLVKEEYGS